MPRPEIVTVEGAITGTLHDGKNMIVLKAGKKVKVAKTSLPFLREKGAIKELTQLDHDGDGAAGGSKPHAAPQSDDRKAAAALYRETVGKNPGPAWDADTILAKLAEHENANGGDGAAGGDDQQNGAIEVVADGETHEAQLGNAGDPPAARAEGEAAGGDAPAD